MHPFYFCNNFVKTHCISDTEVNFQQKCNKIAHISWRLFSPYLVKRNKSAAVRFTAVTCDLTVIRVFAFGFETHIKTILLLINRLISEARFNHMLLQLIDVTHWFLINTFLRVGFSRCLQALVWFSCSQRWKWILFMLFLVVWCPRP